MKRVKFTGLLLCLLFCFGSFSSLIYFSSATTSYPTGADPPTVTNPTVFEDFDFNETEPGPDMVGSVFAYAYDSGGWDSASGGLSDTLVDDSNYHVGTESSASSDEKYYRYYFSVLKDTSTVDKVKLTYVAWQTGTTDIHLWIQNGTYGPYYDYGAIPTSESPQTITLEPYMVNSSGVLAIIFYSNTAFTGSLYVDYLNVQVKTINGEYTSIWAEDFSHVADWSGTISTDGDIATVGSANWFDPSWQYRKKLTIIGDSDAGANYPIWLRLYYGSGTDSGRDVYFNSKCKTDFGDIRFTDNDGVTLLNYYFETKSDSNYALVWVEVTDSLSSNVDIYLYYGNSGASSASDITWFEAYDDGGTSGFANWWHTTTGSSSIINNSGYIEITGSNSIDDAWTMQYDTNGDSSFIASIWTYDSGGTSDSSTEFIVLGVYDYATTFAPDVNTIINTYWRIGVSRKGENNANDGKMQIKYVDNLGTSHYYRTDGTWTTTFDSSCWWGSDGGTYIVKLGYNGTHFFIWIYDTNGDLIDSDLPTIVAESDVKTFNDDKIIVTGELYTSHYYATTKFDKHLLTEWQEDISPNSWASEETNKAETTAFRQSISTTVPFIEFYLSTVTTYALVNITATTGGEKSIANLTTTGVFRYNLYELFGSDTAEKIELEGYFKTDYFRFYGLEDYTVGSDGDKTEIGYQSSNNLVTDLDTDKVLNLTQDITDFSLDTYPYCRVDFTGSGNITVVALTSTNTEIESLTFTSSNTLEFTSTSNIQKLRLMIYGNLTVDFVTFSIMEVNIDSITVNYENTYLSTDQQITITGITAEWEDGTPIPAFNIRFNIIENSTILQGNITNSSLPFSRDVQFFNTTYNIGVQWCNDSRYRYWVLGTNYTFWIIGTIITLDFEYDWEVLSSGGYLGTYYQLNQLQFSNGTVITSGATLYMWANTTSKGYETFTSSGWLPNRMTFISLSSTSGWVNIWFNVSIGDFWQIVENTTFNLPEIAESYKAVRIDFYNQRGEYLEFDSFRTKIHHDFDNRDEWLYYNVFEMNEFSTIDIYVYDRFDTLIYSASDVSYTAFMSIQITCYSYKINNHQEDFVHINLTKSGTSEYWSEWLAPYETAEYYLYNGTYNLKVTYTNSTYSYYSGIPITTDYYFLIEGDTLQDILGNIAMVDAHLDNVNTSISNQIYSVNITVGNVNSSISNQIVTVNLNLDNVNTTITTQIVDLNTLINNVNSSISGQINDVYVEVLTFNATIDNQTNQILLNITNQFNDVDSQLNVIEALVNNIDSDITAQTNNLTVQINNLKDNITVQFNDLGVSVTNLNTTMLTQFNDLYLNLTNINSSIATQFLWLSSNITNINTTMGAQYLDILTHINNLNSTMLSQFVTVITDIYNTNQTVLQTRLDLISKINWADQNALERAMSILTGQEQAKTEIQWTAILGVIATIASIIVSFYTIYRKIVKPYGPKVKKLLETASLKDIIARKKKKPPLAEIEEKRRRAEERRRNA